MPLSEKMTDIKKKAAAVKTNPKHSAKKIPQATTKKKMKSAAKKTERKQWELYASMIVFH
jgi:hypothetical protein